MTYFQHFYCVRIKPLPLNKQMKIMKEMEIAYLLLRFGRVTSKETKRNDTQLGYPQLNPNNPPVC